MDVFEYNEIPSGILEVDSTQLLPILKGPSLIHLKGRRDPPLFVSTLLHGNETTGFEALKVLLRRYEKNELPRSMILFFGNLEAATKRKRRLPGQNDYNRIWAGDSNLPESKIAQQVFEKVSRETIFASIDIHNTTGRNPIYACVNFLDPRSLNLARLFSRIIVYFLNPKEVLSHAMARFGPSVTVEGGISGDPERENAMVDFLDACLHLNELPAIDPKKQDFDLYHSFGKIVLPEDSTVGIGEQCDSADFCFNPEFDKFNFCEIQPGTKIGKISEEHLRMIVLNEQGQDLDGNLFTYQNNEIIANRTMMPSLFSVDPEVIRQDCVGYLMEKFTLSPELI